MYYYYFFYVIFVLLEEQGIPVEFLSNDNKKLTF